MNILLQTLEKLNDGTFYEPLGSNNQMIIDDLKTLRGVLNRIKNYNLNHSKSFRLYRYTGYLCCAKDFKLIYERIY